MSTEVLKIGNNTKTPISNVKSSGEGFTPNKLKGKF
jgi:hypothetical protein